MTAYASFRERALHESLRYGDDPYVFLRELVQNARDAGARQVEVSVTVEGGRTCIVFDDDGVGMSFKHAKAFLFRLYASSKENDDDNAGHFGVGFWSVLRWAPESLRIASRTADKRGEAERWGVELDSSLSRVTDVPCALAGHGTRIVLERATRDDDLPALARTVRDRLSYYCRYVRVRGGKTRLALLCNGERVDRELDVASVMEDEGGEATLAMTFSVAGASGIVALAATPKVQLYARGLLVSCATVLDELDGATSGRRDAIGSRGLAPVVVLNSDRLDVVLSRRRARDGRELRRLMRLARARLDRLVSHAVDGVVERTIVDRASDMLAEGVRALGGGLAVAVLVVWLLVIGAGALAALLLWRVPQGSAGERTVITVVRGSAALAAEGYRVETPPVAVGSIDPSALPGVTRPFGNIVGYGGAIVDVPDSYGPAWSFGYRGPSRVFFKALTLDDYEANHGFVRRELPVTGSYLGPTSAGCGRGGRACIDVVTQVVANDAPFVLPVPTGYGVVDHSVTIDGVPQELATNGVDEALLQLDAGRRGTLRYQVAPVPALPSLDLAVEPTSFGEPWDGLLARAARLPMPRRVELVTSFVRDTIRYDVTPMTAAMFAHAHGDWHSRVLAVGAGDCDVKNGLNALLLRQLGVDARLAIGIAGEDGMARPSLHAWTEYRAGGRWHVVDATGQPAAFDVAAERARELAVRRNADPAVLAVGVPSAADAPTRRRALPQERRASIAPDISSRAEPPHGAPVAETIASQQPSIAVEPMAVPTGGVAPSRPETQGAPVSPMMRRLGPLVDRCLAGARVLPGPLVWALLLGIPALVSVVFLSRRRVRESLVDEGPQDAKREALAKMVHDMLTQPHAWRGIGRAWHQRLLPVLAGRPMSLEEALRRARDNVLFVSRSRSKLADLAASCGTPVLDAADPFFGSVVVPLLRTVDLDSIEPLLSGGGDASRPYAGLARANAVLAEAKADVRFVLADALQDAPLRDVDLTRVQLPRKLGTPRRFIAVSPSHREVRARLDKLERDPERGVFIWLDWSVERSELLAEHTSEVRKHAAAYAVDVLGGGER